MKGRSLTAGRNHNPRSATCGRGDGACCSRRTADASPCARTARGRKGKKHPCKDCRFCQWCSDTRCDLCRSKGSKFSGMPYEEQIAIFEKMNKR